MSAPEQPAAFDLDATVVHPLPEGWVLLWYGTSSAYLRRKLREAAGRGGLLKADSGGSVYAGVARPELDREIDDLARRLSRGEVHLVPGSFSQVEAGWFTRGVADSALRDISKSEAEVRELERAMAGDAELRHPKTGKPKNLVSTGDGRLAALDFALEAADTAAQRLAAFPGTAEVAERLATRVAQGRAWGDKVRESHKRQRERLQAEFEQRLAKWEADLKAAAKLDENL